MLNVQYIESSESEELDSDYESDLILDKVVNRLTEFVRKQYCTYMEKVLTENYQSWCLQNLGHLEAPPTNWIKKCVATYEDKAIKSCMIVQFYRKSMLQTMAKIQKNTIIGKLAKNIKRYSENTYKTSQNFRRQSIDVGSQTEDIIQENKIDTTNDSFRKSKTKSYENLSLDDKIELFKERIIGNTLASPEICTKRKRIPSPIKPHRSRQKYYHNIPKLTEQKTVVLQPQIPIFPEVVVEQKNTIKIPEIIQTNNDLAIMDLERQLDEIFEPKQDDIAKELDKLFHDEQNEIDEIFGCHDTVKDPQIDSILKEIELATLPSQRKLSIDPAVEIIPVEEKSPVLNEPKSLALQKFIDKTPEINHDEILKDSLWPCELHMRKQKLRDLLAKVGEEFGMRCHERLKIKFFELFGEDDDDEFGAYSPTLELNEVLLSSCKKRIAPWIVKYLMRPLNEGLIANRYIFKKFAKRMAHKIVLEDQYSNERYVKHAIEEYFCLHRCISSIEDMDI